MAVKPIQAVRRQGAGAAIVATLAMLSLVGCGTTGVNPSFPVTRERAEADLARLAEAPVDLPRPVIVLGGWMDMGLDREAIQRRIEASVRDKHQVLGVGFIFVFSFEAARARVIEAVKRAYPGGQMGWTREVDVVAFSMGGLVAREAAAPPTHDAADPTRLRIARLFTLATPHRGARLARWPTLGRMTRAMRPGSPLLRRLDAVREADPSPYPIIPYARLGDRVVGAVNASPPGGPPWWVSTPAMTRAHVDAPRDPRLADDIIRRLRGEPPRTHAPPAPLPTSAGG